MNTLYEIESAILECYDKAVDKETGEIVDKTALEKLKDLQLDETKKLKGYRWIIKKLESEQELAKAEKKRLNDFQNVCKRNIEKMKNFLLEILPHQSNKLVGINFRKVQVVELDDIFNLPPDEEREEGYYKIKITYTPNKDKIKQALKNGEEIKGAKLVEKDSISFGAIKTESIEEGSEDNV